MKNKLLAGLATGAALVYCTHTCVCQSIPTEMPFRMTQDALVVVSLQINGQGPFDFVLDTGTDFTIIDSALADKLGLVRSNPMQQVSIAGRRMVDRSTIAKLALAYVQVDNLPVLVENLGQIRKAAPHVKGILSQDFLTHFNYLIDYSKRVLRIESRSEFRDSLEGPAVPLEPRHDARDKMIITVDAQALNHSTMRFVLDSGATSVVLMRDAWKKLQVRELENRWVQTPIGLAAVHSGRIRWIALGTQQLRDVLAISSAETASQVGDGLLPTSLFHSIYVNNRENFVILNPRFKESSHRR